ncbi:MAG: SDR family oxidoreductase [Burkholderiales bacterium]|nr:MAG: SDR family oxidoreductase [Burkholderiales bacterium]TAG81234.1 MAG: SDR family oxidoreductase [Betaproteobacteria bacterium]
MNAIESLFRLDHKIAVITGGSTGIGRSMAWALGMQGAKLVIVARTRSSLEETVSSFAKDGIDAKAVVADLGVEAERHRAIAECSAAFARSPDILVNNAANNIRKPMPELSDEDVRVTLALNLEAPIALVRAFAPAMAARGWGRIVNLGSQQTHRAFNNSGVYGVAKGAIASLTRSTAEHYTKFGVTCNTVVPGFVVTPLTEQLVAANPEFAAAHAARSMIGRNGVPDDFRGVAVFLCSNASAYVSGATFCIDGGYGAT